MVAHLKRRLKQQKEHRHEREIGEDGGNTVERYLNILCAWGLLNLAVLMVFISHRGLQRHLAPLQAGKWSRQITNNELWLMPGVMHSAGGKQHTHTHMHADTVKVCRTIRQQVQASREKDKKVVLHDVRSCAPAHMYLHNSVWVDLVFSADTRTHK